jgi:putative FmdB family regulatory protein
MAGYDFLCEACGRFEVHRPMAHASDPAPCPTCGEAGRRVFSPPGLVRTSTALGRALDIEARSAHEPAITGVPHGRAVPALHGHGPSPPWTAPVRAR